MVELTEEEKEKFDLLEAKRRQFYDPEERIFNYNKKRVTDIRENARVTLPKAVKEIQEAGIEIRRQNIKRLVQEYRESTSNGKSASKSNLTNNEKAGLKSLKRRMKSGEVIIMRTDKSSKMAITDVDTYMKLGEKHIKNDKEITLKEVAGMEKDVNGNTSMFIKMTGMGDDWGQGDRMRTSTITRSKTMASLFLQLKDHKVQLDIRALVSACDSYIVDLSNILS